MSKVFELDTLPLLDCHMGWRRDPPITTTWVNTLTVQNEVEQDSVANPVEAEDRGLVGVFFISGFYRATAAQFDVRLHLFAMGAGSDPGIQIYCRVSRENWRDIPNGQWSQGYYGYLFSKAESEHVFYTMPRAEYIVTGWKYLELEDDDLPYVNTWGHTAFWMNMHGVANQEEKCKWNSGNAVAKNRPLFNVTVEPATCRAKHGHACGPVRACVGQIAPA